MKFYDAKASFAAGELSPVLAARGDLAAYMIGAKELTNALVLPQGGWCNRPGTRKLAAASGARLIPFVAREGGSFCLVFMPSGIVDVYNSSGVKLYSFADSPYSTSTLPRLRYLQSVDVMYLFCQDVPVMKLEHRSNTDWRFVEVDFKDGPYRDLNTGDTKLDISSSGNILYSDTPGFFSGEGAPEVGEKVYLEYKVKARTGNFQLKSHNPDDIAVSEEFMLFGASTIESRGVWYGTAEIGRKGPEEDDEWETVRTFPSRDPLVNVGYSADEEEYGVMYRVTFFSDDSNNNERINVFWTSGGGIFSRQVMITTLSPAYGNLAFIKPLDNISGGIPPTADWAFGAFSPRFGYPALGIFHQERLVLANTKEDPETMWFSQSASWENFGTSIPAEDTDAITVTLAAKQLNEIRGMASRSDLLIFTSGGEWTAKAGSKSDVFTPSSIVVTPSGYRGSANIEPIDVGNVTLFAQRHGKVVRGMGYQLDIDGYSSSELSVLSPHLFEDSRVTRWAYQQDPWSIVWIVLDSGVVLTLTLQQEHQVTAWARQVFNGNVKDICCIPGDGQDEVFMLTGNNLAMLRHRVDKNFTPDMYLDGGTDPYTTSFESMELEQGAGNGSLQGRHKHVAGATLRLFRACGLKTGIMTENSSKIDPVVFPGDLSPRNRPDPYTGDVYVKMPGGVSRTCRVRVENSAPQPVTLLGIFQEVEINEG